VDNFDFAVDNYTDRGMLFTLDIPTLLTVGLCFKIVTFYNHFQQGEPILNQYSISYKSLILLKNLFFELNALDIFESPKICNALQRSALGRG
jgi:hypothetical protein